MFVFTESPGWVWRSGHALLSSALEKSFLDAVASNRALGTVDQAPDSHGCDGHCTSRDSVLVRFESLWMSPICLSVLLVLF